MSSMPQSRAPCDCVLRQASNGGQAAARLRQATAAAQRTNTQDVHSLSHLVRTRLVDALSTPRVGTVAGLHRRGAGGERPSRLPGGRRQQRQRRRLAAQCPRVRRARRHPRRLSMRSERSQAQPRLTWWCVSRLVKRDSPIRLRRGRWSPAPAVPKLLEALCARPSAAKGREVLLAGAGPERKACGA